MKRYIKSSINSELWEIGVSGVNGGSHEKLAQKLRSLFYEIPIGRYVLSIGNRGYATGYCKVSPENLKWLYDNELHKISGYWDTGDTYIVLPATFKPTGRIDYDDDNVVVYEVFDSEELIYSGLEDYEPIKNEDWSYCKPLKMYYLIDYAEHKIYVKWKIG